MASRSLLREIIPQELFNLPLYEHHLVIDTRSAADYHLGHIATAVSLPSPPLDASEGERESLLLGFVKSYIKDFSRPENPSPIVLYGSDRAECIKHTQWLAEKLAKLQTDRKTLVTIAPDATPVGDEQDFDPFEQFVTTIADRVKEIWILKGGYEAFQSEYDFLCGCVPFESMFPVPHQISPGLLLGSRVVSLKQDVLSKLRVTHLIVSNRQELDWREMEGVSVLQCDVADSNAQDMSVCWNSCVLFIHEALSQKEGPVRPLVLVQLHGRSRSTSVLMAYLIRTLRIGFDEAWGVVTDKCWHLIDRSLVYEQQLRNWQIAETRSIAK